MEKVVSGMRPTGYLHLGNYFGAMQNFLKMQDHYDCYFFVADWHALTTHPDTQQLAQDSRRVIAEYVACGLDPEKVSIYIQSQIPEIAELYLILNTLAYKGELEKTNTFKEKIRQHSENINAGLLTYPVLQAADILIHQAHKVPAGKDQEQHLEMARNFAQRFNYRYGDLFPEPQQFNFGVELIKIPSLDGKGKMSKSENEQTTIYLKDSPEELEKKIKKMPSDQGPSSLNQHKPDVIQNLFDLLQLVAPQDAMAHFEEQYNQCTIRYGEMKQALTLHMNRFLKPLQERKKEIESTPHLLDSIILKGRAKASASAKKTIETMRNKMKLNY